jgi:hypothetical protein
VTKVEKLILDKEAIEKMGLASDTIYCIEYDLNSRHTIPKNATEQEKREIQLYNKKAEQIRNRMKYALKFEVMASRHLESSWLISADRLEEAEKQLEEIKSDMLKAGFDNVDKRIRIIPILTTIEGYENYEDHKMQFLLDFAMEHTKMCDKALSEGRMRESNLWRAKKAYEIINALAEELKSEDAQNEVHDTVEILSDKIAQVEAMLQDKEAEEKKKKEKEAEQQKQ